MGIHFCKRVKSRHYYCSKTVTKTPKVDKTDVFRLKQKSLTPTGETF